MSKPKAVPRGYVAREPFNLLVTALASPRDQGEANRVFLLALEQVDSDSRAVTLLHGVGDRDMIDWDHHAGKIMEAVRGLTPPQREKVFREMSEYVPPATNLRRLARLLLAGKDFRTSEEVRELVQWSVGKEASFLGWIIPLVPGTEIGYWAQARLSNLGVSAA